MFKILFVLIAVAAAVEYGYIWQITDTHLQPGYTIGSDAVGSRCQTKSANAEREAGKHGDYNCDSPSGNIDAAFLHTQILEHTGGKAPDVVLWTGDHITGIDTDQGEEQTLVYLRNITNQLVSLKKALPNTKIFPMLGNHDTYPMFHFAERGPFFVYDYIADAWKDFLSDSAIETLKKAMYYTEVITPGFRLVAYNTILYYFLNKKTNDDMADPGDQFAWLKETLTKARENNEKVLLMAHLPPGRGVLGGGQEFYPKLHDAWITFLSDYHDIIIGGVYGHDHSNGFHLVYGVKDGAHDTSKGSVHFVAPSLTTGNNKNPALTLYKYIKEPPFTLVDRTVFYAHIPTVNKEDKMTFASKFSLSEYGVPDLTLKSLESLVDRLEGNETLFTKFRHELHTNSDVASYEKCDDACKTKIFCRIRKSLFSLTTDCK